MIFLAVLLQKLQSSCKIGALSATIFRIGLYIKWTLLVLSSQYRAFMDIMSTRMCGIPVLEKRLCSLTMETKV